MKKLLYLLIFGFLAEIQVLAVPNYVGGNCKASAASPNSVTYASTPGNFLVAGVWGTPVTNVFSVADSNSTSWHAGAHKSFTNWTVNMQLFFLANSPAVSSVTVTYSGTQGSICVAEFSGVLTATTDDGSGSATGSSGTFSSGSFAETSGDLIIGFLGTEAGGSNTAGSGPPTFTMPAAVNPGGGVSIEWGVSAAATATANGTGGNSNWIAIGEAFLPNAAVIRHRASVIRQ